MILESDAILTAMKIGLVGWGLETQSAYKYFGPDHDYLIMNEEPRDDFPSGNNITVQANSDVREPGLTSNAADLTYLRNIENCDKIILSPTAAKTLEKVHPRSSLIWQKVTTNTQIFFEQCPTKNIIGVTGTKGKGTTTTLIGLLLTAMGKKVHVGGNIGIPVLDMLPDILPGDWVVLEMSNFQLYHFPYSPKIAVHLMLMPEHIEEWHIEVEDYVNAKANIFRHQNETDIAIYLPTNKHSSQSALLSPGRKISYNQAPGAHVNNDWIVMDEERIIPLSEVGLRGVHNLENICAAVTTAWQIQKDPQVMRTVIRNFTGLEHRLQHIRTLDEISYFDDSFGTTPDTAVVAMNAFTQPKVMIIGGHDKGNNMQPMIERLSKTDIRCVIGVGIVGKKIIEELRLRNLKTGLFTKEDYNNWTMDEIVTLARSEAHPGDIVLLSAGTSSFGIFKDYKDRGNQFIASVKSLS